ncbi:hypothetical protein QEH59_01005 [Coraliomargarita sp. SDUM461004]|uniref:Uncharacterized protein n=1 Tax=Thalassobacterium sedimentorum TaxID=3041258 RepID=A0ABU1AE14_9BACT|nr:hypothetical protein [Coraliomargarita sp. SDUM461004]MDQ8192984.1 hypothetical protein [Coraliomargarita sp. SDUM461004]
MQNFQQHPSPNKPLQSHPKRRKLAACICALALGAITSQAQDLLLNDTFSRSAKGTFLEQSAGLEWEAQQGRLIIGNGRPLNGQALSYAPNRTWDFQIYNRDLNATLSPEEAIEMSFSAAVKTDASPEFYIYSMRLIDKDNYVQIQVKGGAKTPTVTVEAVINGKKSQSEVEDASYYETSEGTGLVAVKLLVSEGYAQAYCDWSGENTWSSPSKPITFQLTTIDQIQLRYYAMGYWSAMDDLKVAIIKPTQQ